MGITIQPAIQSFPATPAQRGVAVPSWLDDKSGHSDRFTPHTTTLTLNAGRGPAMMPGDPALRPSPKSASQVLWPSVNPADLPVRLNNGQWRGPSHSRIVPPLEIPKDPPGLSPSKLSPPGDLGLYYVSLGERYYDVNRFQQALSAFTIATQLNQQDYVAFNKRGVVHAGLKDYAAAMADYTMAIAIKPDFYNAYVNRGNLKVYVKDYRGALADYDQAVRINPWHSAAYENRAEVYNMLGRRDLALRDKAAIIWIEKLKKPLATQLSLNYCPKRVALVLWNDDYAGTENDLHGGPARDGMAMSSVLQSQGFDVLTGVNLNGPQMKQRVREFIDTLNRNPGAISLIYYSGHGGSIKGNNYLIPVEYTGTVDPDFVQNTVSVDYLMRELKGANSLFNMVFLDACRTPLAVPPPQSGANQQEILRQWESEPGPGLSNVWIEYASRPKMPALQDENSGLYTKYLLQYMTNPELSLKEVSMYTSFALEQDPTAVQQNQHSRVQSDLSKTEALAESFSFARPCSLKGEPRMPATQNQFRIPQSNGTV